MEVTGWALLLRSHWLWPVLEEVAGSVVVPRRFEVSDSGLLLQRSLAWTCSSGGCRLGPESLFSTKKQLVSKSKSKLMAYPLYSVLQNTFN